MMYRHLGVACAILVATPALAVEVLGPGQDERALEVRDRLLGVLGEGESVASIRIDREALLLTLRSGAETRELQLRSPNGECVSPSCEQTGQGNLHGLTDLPPSLNARIQKALSKGPPLLSWHKVVSKRSPRTPGPVEREQPTPPQSLDEALAALTEGRTEDVVALTKVLIRNPERTPPGAMSLYLGSGGEAPASLDTMLEQFPLDSRLHALVAQQARQEGDSTRAARHLARALSLPLVDSLAVALARREGWSTADSSLGPEPALPVEPSHWPWLFGYGVLCVLGWQCHRRKARWTFVVLTVSMLCSALLPMGAGSLERPEVTRFQLPSEQDHQCSFETGGWIHDEFTLLARCGGQNHVLHLRQKDTTSRALVATTHHAITLRGEGSRMLRKDIHRLAAELESQEGRGFRLTASTEGISEVLAPRTKGQAWQLRFTFVLVFASLLLLGAAIGQALREIGQAVGRLKLRARLVFTAAVVLFLAEQFAVGLRPIMVFEGYALTEGLAAGEIPRYGAGTLLFYGWTQWFGVTDHAHLMILNLGFGTACIIVLLAWMQRLANEKPWRLVWSAVLVLCLPVIARTHGSESILVGPTLAILGGLFCLAGRSPGRYVAAAVLFGAAALSRPEMAVVVPFLPAFAHVLSGKQGRPAPNVSWACLLAISLLAVWAALDSAASMSARDALPATERGIGPVIAAMTVDGILTDIRCFPVVLSLLGLWALTDARFRRVAWVSWLLVLGWMALTGVDHTSASTPRTHLPIAFMMFPLLTTVWTSWVETSWVKEGKRSAIGVFAVLVLAGSSLSGWYVHSHNNDDAEEGLWKALVMDVNDEHACLVAVGDNDPPDRGRTSRHNPEYWIAHTHPGWSIHPLSELKKVRQRCSGKVYALLGVRCYTQIREPGEPVPDGNAMHPICANVLEEEPVRRVIEWDIENRSQMSHPMYPNGSPLRIGVYELGGLGTSKPQ